MRLDANRLSNGQYRFDKSKSCKHNDCKYVAPKRNGTYCALGHCDYMQITGRSRIAQLPEGEARWPINCPFYEKEGEK